MKPLTDNSFVSNQDGNMIGRRVKVANKITLHPPLAMFIEVLEGPMAGTKMVNVYTSKGGKTAFDVYR